MQNAEGLSSQQINEFLKGSAAIEFTATSRSERYAWIEKVLVSQEFGSQGKKQRGVLRAYIEKITGMSTPQLTRLIRMYLSSGIVKPRSYRRCRFASKYTEADIALLAAVDRAHEGLNGPATRCVLERELNQFNKHEYARLAKISTAHLYNLRNSVRYRKLAAVFQPTRPNPVSIGERRKPDPQGRPGFLRIDTVHQGDWNGVKGVYHVNAVDSVTQWQVIGCVGRISEQFMLPVLVAMLHQFPFQIRGFHSDNGSEFVNHDVAKLLKSLLIEFTRSRASRTQDNALVEGKNGAIIRKHLGYGHIPAEHADTVQKFYTAQLNPYLNFHRPCGFATVSLDARGKRQRKYKREDYATPYDKLKSLPEAEKYLKSNMSFAQLNKTALQMSDTECARKMTAAKTDLLCRCKIESPVPLRLA